MNTRIALRNIVEALPRRITATETTIIAKYVVIRNLSNGPVVIQASSRDSMLDVVTLFKTQQQQTIYVVKTATGDGVQLERYNQDVTEGYARYTFNLNSNITPEVSVVGSLNDIKHINVFGRGTVRKMKIVRTQGRNDVVDIKEDAIDAVISALIASGFHSQDRGSYERLVA